MSNQSNPIEIPEYGTVKLKCLNSEVDLPYLKQPCFKYETASPYRIWELKDDTVVIENSSYSGIIQLDSVRIHFSTKVSTNLFYMLSFLKDEHHFCYDSDKIIDIKEGANFFDILGRLFLNELDAIAQRGFCKKYVRKQENIPFLKGKMLVNKQLKNHIASRPRFSCSYDDLTFDNLENQIILKATMLLIPLIRFNEEIKKDLFRHSHNLRDAVSLVNIVPEDCSRVQYSRLNDYYEPIIQFSKVILQDYFIRSTHKGESRGFNFIVNMNKVYEDFVTELVNQIVREEKEFRDYVALPQTKFQNLVKEGTINIKPDIILKHKDKQEYPLIIDAKYKKQDANADYYQAIAYALGIPKVKACCLLYPLHLDPEVQTYTLDVKPFGSKIPEIKLHALKIDLFGDRNLSFGEYIKSIRATLKKDMLRCLGYA